MKEEKKSFWQLIGEYAKISFELRRTEFKEVITEVKEFAALVKDAAKITLCDKIKKEEKNLLEKHKDNK